MQFPELLKGCISGDRKAQSQLYEKYAPVVFPVCLRYAGNRQEAEDILLEGFHKAFKHIAKFKGTGSFEGWLRKIMVNMALEQINRKPKMYPLMPIKRAEEEQALMPDIEQHVTIKELIQLIQKLPPAYRAVFNLYVFDGFKHREIAVILGISVGTSKSNLSDARRILRQHLFSIQQYNDVLSGNQSR